MSQSQGTRICPGFLSGVALLNESVSITDKRRLFTVSRIPSQGVHRFVLIPYVFGSRICGGKHTTARYCPGSSGESNPLSWGLDANIRSPLLSRRSTLI